MSAAGRVAPAILCRRNGEDLPLILPILAPDLHRDSTPARFVQRDSKVAQQVSRDDIDPRASHMYAPIARIVRMCRRDKHAD
jgi:hypothetical protein